MHQLLCKIKDARLAFLTITVFLVMSTDSNAQIEIRNVEVKGMTFKCRTSGDPTSQAVILLHGWPETSHSSGTERSESSTIL